MDITASHICCNSTELMAAIRQDIVSSGIASLSGESGRSVSHDSPAISPTLSPTTDTLSAAAGAPMISTDAGEETDSLNDSHASSVDTTPYKRFFDQTDNARCVQIYGIFSLDHNFNKKYMALAADIILVQFFSIRHSFIKPQIHRLSANNLSVHGTLLRLLYSLQQSVRAFRLASSLTEETSKEG